VNSQQRGLSHRQLRYPGRKKVPATYFARDSCRVHDFAVATLLPSVKSEWQSRPIDWRGFAGRGSLLVLGAIAPFALTCLILRALGVFERFWFWTFSYAWEYATRTTVSDAIYDFSMGILRVVGPSVLIWVVAGVGLAALIWDRNSCARRPFVLGLLVFSFLAICPGLHFRPHYFILILPAVALLAGFAVCFAEQHLQRAGWPRFVAAFCFVAALCFSLSQQRSFLFEMDPIAACRATYGSNPFPESLEVARYLRDHTSEADRLAVLGSEPQIYFYAGRHSATGYIYTYGLMEEQKYASQMQKELIGEIEAARPAYLVMVNSDTSWLVRPNSDRTIFSWINQYVAQQYGLDGIVDVLSEEQTIYRWGDEAGRYQVNSPNNLRIFKRIAP